MKVVAYYRVSTAAQGRSGLGLEAQRAAVEAFCQGRSCHMLAEYTEVESGEKDSRPELEKALHYARVTGARLVIAKMDRLSRDLHFVTKLQKSGAQFTAADLPEADEFTVHIFVAAAQRERKLIAERTKAALAAAKARGVKLGNPNGAAALRRAGKGNGAAVGALKEAADRHATDLAPVVAHLQAEGHTSLPALAKALNERQMRTPRGGQWHPSSVRNLLARLDAAA